jgi:glycosyltransferase involved in cell wall biosynthesis
LILFLRLFKVAVFPYLVTEDNRVYGATGAARLAMATGTPTVVSESHLFDDLTGVSPRPSSAEELADELGKLFNDSRYRDDMISTQSKYVNETTWDRVADMYLEARNNLVI